MVELLTPVIEGNLQIHEGASLDEQNTAILTKNPAENGVLLRLPGGDSRPARVALFAGPPLDQVVYTRGPFVMTNKKDAYAAVDDFNAHRNGFENVEGWRSSIGACPSRGGTDHRQGDADPVPRNRDQVGSSVRQSGEMQQSAELPTRDVMLWRTAGWDSHDILGG
jgi:hypothetical protein